MLRTTCTEVQFETSTCSAQARTYLRTTPSPPVEYICTHSAHGLRERALRVRQENKWVRLRTASRTYSYWWAFIVRSVSWSSHNSKQITINVNDTSIALLLISTVCEKYLGLSLVFAWTKWYCCILHLSNVMPLVSLSLSYLSLNTIDIIVFRSHNDQMITFSDKTVLHHPDKPCHSY